MGGGPISNESEARDPNGGNVYYVTMQISFHIPEFACKERNLHCDVVYITTVWVSRGPFKCYLTQIGVGQFFRGKALRRCKVQCY